MIILLGIIICVCWIKCRIGFFFYLGGFVFMKRWNSFKDVCIYGG